MKEPKLIRLKVSAINQNAHNPRQHDKEQLRLLQKSLDHYGIVALPIVQKGTNNLIAGHGRIQALLALGKKDQIIPVLEVEMSDQDAQAYTITDNRLTDLSTWKVPELKELITSLDDGAFDMELTGYDEDALKALFPEEDTPPEKGDGDGEGDGNKTQLRPGDTVVMGAHLCLEIGEAALPDNLDEAAALACRWMDDTGGTAQVLRGGKEIACDLK